MAEEVKKEEVQEEEMKEEPKEDEYLAMMKQEEEEKKARIEEAGEEEIPAEEKDLGEELSLIKVKKRKPKKKKKEKKEEKEKKSEVKKKEKETSKAEPLSAKNKSLSKPKEEPKAEAEITEDSDKAKIYALRTTANREDQVMDFVSSNAARKKLAVYSIIRPHGMRGYIFLEAGNRGDAEQAAFGVPYARGLLPNIIQYSEIEHMLEQVKKEMNIQKNDIAEIISGPFKREKCKITRIDRAKEEVVVELLEAAVPIPITVKMDAVRVIRRESEEGKEK